MEVTIEFTLSYHTSKKGTNSGWHLHSVNVSDRRLGYDVYYEEVGFMIYRIYHSLDVNAHDLCAWVAAGIS